MDTLLTISAALERFNTRVGKVSAWLLMPLMFVIILDVITRKFGLLTSLREYFLNADMDGGAEFIQAYLTSTKFQELEWHLHAALFLLCLGFGYIKNSHVRIEIVREQFDTRTKATLEIIGSLFFLTPYAALVLYFGIDFAERSYQMNEVSAALTGLSHRWIIKSFVPLGMILLLIAAVTVVLRNIAYLMAPDGEAGAAYDMALELHSPEDDLRKIEEQDIAEAEAELAESDIKIPDSPHRNGSN